MIFLPDDRDLAAAGWVTRGILDELSARSDLPPALAEKVRWCLDAEFYDLDLRDASAADLAALVGPVDQIIAATERAGSASFQQPEMFPAYLGLLRELRALLDPSFGLDGATVFEYGSEHAPDSPAGLERLVLEPDGRFRFENRRAGQLLVARTGTIGRAEVIAAAGALVAAGFPAVPDHDTLPGADCLTISSGDRHAVMGVTSARHVPGYGPLIRRLLPWLRYLVDLQGEAPAGLRVDRPPGA